MSSVAASASVGMRIPATDIGFGGQRTLATDDGRSISAQELISRATRFNESTHFSDTMRTAAEEARTLNERSGQSEGKDYLSGISSDFSQAQVKADSSNASLSKERTYRETANYVESNGVSIAQDLNQVYADILHKKHGVDEARRIMADPMRNGQHLSDFVDGHRDQILEKLQQDAPKMTMPQAINKDYVQNKSTTERSGNVGADFSGKSEIVQKKAQTENLSEDLQPGLGERIDNNINNARARISQDKSKLMDNRSAEFSQHKKDENDVTGKIFD